MSEWTARPWGHVSAAQAVTGVKCGLCGEVVASLERHEEERHGL